MCLPCNKFVIVFIGASTGGGSSANPIGSSATGASGGSGTTDGSGQPWELGVTDSAGVGSGGIKGGKTGAEYSTLIGGGGNNDVISWEEPEWFILLPDAVRIFWNEQYSVEISVFRCNCTCIEL